MQSALQKRDRSSKHPWVQTTSMRSRTTRLVACALITQFFSLSTISISRTRDSRKQRRAPQNQDAATGVLATAEIPFALITRHRQFWRKPPSDKRKSVG